ncbi:MAG TPA: endolytic transglycosylase MltG, partial [Chloroflexi bacterium]|nr:endolytic transglycosylase MltG [Chloroflexota bacterium]
MNSTDTTTRPFFLIAFIVLFLFVMGLMLVTILLFVPTATEEIFGPPASNQNPLQIISRSTVLVLNYQDLIKPIGSEGMTFDFVIVENQTARDIAQNLEAQGLITDANLFINYLTYKGFDRNLKQGTYTLEGKMTAVDMAEKFQNPTITFSILAGWRLEEVANSIASYWPIDTALFLDMARHPQQYDITSPLPIENGLEGLLLSGDYIVERSAVNEKQILIAMLTGMERNLTPELLTGYQNNGLSLYQTLIMASMVEKEALSPAEMPLIASVFYNRIEANMRFQSDPTVQFAIGYDEGQQTWWVNPLPAGFDQIDSPYNTYRYEGLPPTPICAPSLNALQAAANPAESDYYFFRAKCDGSGEHNFSRTYEEHLN